MGQYFEALMRRRPQSSGGYIDLPKDNFKRMVARSKNENDLAALINAHVNYLGHRNLLPHSYVDAMLLKALELGQPKAMFDVLRLHAELLYHPSAAVLGGYLRHFKNASYDDFKAFFAAVRGNYFLQWPKEEPFHTTAIELAFANKDGKIAIEAYLDILDYEASGLTAQHLQKVFESFDYSANIDHALVEHLGKTAAKLGLASDATLKMHHALYFYKVKGYLSSVDLLKEVATGSSKIGKSELLKKEFFAAFFADATITEDIKSQLVNAIKGIPSSLWEDRAFYGIEEHLTEKQAKVEEVPV